MQRPEGTTQSANFRVPWNKGKFIGAKPPLRTKHVWSIRTKLQVEGRKRDLAMFNLAIDSELRGCGRQPQVETVVPHGITVARATAARRKPGMPVRFELSEQTREPVDSHIQAAKKNPGEFLFASRRNRDSCMTTRQYSRLVSRLGRRDWIGPELFRDRFPAADQSDAHLWPYWKSTCRPIAARHTKIESTVRYLGIEVDDALTISEQVEV